MTSHLGLKSQTIFGSKAILILATSVGLLFTSDEDDYLLRGRISEADAIRVAIQSQRQEWYRDEGSIPLGTVEDNIPYKTESLQYTLGISFGMEL